MSKKHLLSKAVSLCVAAIILLSALAVPMMGIAGTGIVASAAGNTIETATTASFNTNYSGSITDSNTKDYYKYTLSNSGTVSVDFNSDGIERVNITIYNANGDKVWGTSPYWNGTTEKIVFLEDIELVSGTYYLLVEKYYRTGNYNFIIGYSSANESFKETQSSQNNSIATASSISLDKKYNGQIAQNDDKDYYKFLLSNSGTVSLDYSSDGIERVYITIYNEKGEKTWGSSPSWNGTTEKIVYSEDIELVSGTYYFLVEKYYGTGNYSFTLGYSSANESFNETQISQNNTIATASSISLSTNYAGQIAQNDDKDYYKFLLSNSGTISLDYSSDGIERVYITIYNEKGEKTWSSSPSWNGTTEKIVYSEDIELVSGTYYFLVEKYYGTGNYSFNLGYLSANETFKETQISQNNTIATASQISLNKNYKGQIAQNDDKDYYMFTLSNSETVSLSYLSDGIERIYLTIYNEKGEKTWGTSTGWDGTTQQIVFKKDIELVSGAYYFLVEKYYGTGNYSFTISDGSSTVTNYTVYYNANGGTVSPTSAVVSSGSSVTLPTPTKSYNITYNSNGGSTSSFSQSASVNCLGWSTSSGATSASYRCGTSFTPSGNATLYAVWENSTSAQISSQKPSRSGYTFLGWSTSSSATTASYVSGSTINLNGNITLYAVWKKNPVDTVSYTLTYNANGGSYAPYSESGSTSYVISSVEPIRNGYSFLGWSTNSSASFASFHAGDTITLTADTTLYAVWKIRPVVDPDPPTEVCDIAISKPSETSIEYGDSIILHMEIKGALPEGAYIEWSESNGNFDMNVSNDGMTCKITPRSSGKTVFRVTAYDEDGNVIGYASQEMTAKADLWQKIVAFFKKIFGLTRTIPAFYKEVL